MAQGKPPLGPLSHFNQASLSALFNFQLLNLALFLRIKRDKWKLLVFFYGCRSVPTTGIARAERIRGIWRQGVWWSRRRRRQAGRNSPAPQFGARKNVVKEFLRGSLRTCPQRKRERRCMTSENGCPVGRFRTNRRAVERTLAMLVKGDNDGGGSGHRRESGRQQDACEEPLATGRREHNFGLILTRNNSNSSLTTTVDSRLLLYQSGWQKGAKWPGGDVE